MFINDHSGDDVRFLQIHLGGDRNFCYLFGDRATGEGAVVDPGFKPDDLAAIASEHELEVRHIFVTHGHADHMGGAGRLRKLTGAILHSHPLEGLGGSQPIADGEEIRLGGATVTALHTPGHAPGHTCYLFAGRLMTGDLLFCGKVGGTGPGFLGSSAEAEWSSLHRVLALPGDTLVFPGHDYYGGDGTRQHSTVAWEHDHNPFLLCKDLAEFCRLKDNWDAYKREHGIR